MKVVLQGLAIPLLVVLSACSNNGQESTEAVPAGPAPGPDPLTGEIAVELVRYFAGGGNFHDTLPPDFPPFTLPPSFQVLGSKVVDTGEHVLLSTSLEPAVARQAAADAFLAEDGWRVLEPRSRIRSATVFSPARPLAAPNNDEAMLELCHDEHGALRIQAPYLDEDVVSLARRGIDESRPGSYCQRETELRSRVRSSPLDRFQAWQPRLVAPDGQLTGGSRGGSTDGMSTESLLITEDTNLSELARHFAEQMEAQGWMLEADWSGELTAGSAWSLRPEGGEPIAGFLNIVESSDSEFSLKFRLSIQAEN